MSKDKKQSPPKTETPKKTASSRGLGRGLSALMNDVSITSGLVATPEAAKPSTKDTTKARKTDASKSEKQPVTSTTVMRGVTTVSIDQLVRNPDQPRRYFDKALLAELTSSIADKGVLQPILVRPVPSRKTSESGKTLYQIVAGERRWQASLKAGLTSMPVLIRELNDQDVLEIGVVENVQRADLNPIEEALAYRALVDQFSRTQEDIAKAIGKSRSHIANMLRLLSLPKRAQEALQSGLITTGHARAVIAAPDPNVLVEEIIDKGLSVRDAESWVRRIKAEGEGRTLPHAAPEQKSADIKKLEQELSDITGLSVEIKHRGPHGELRLKYKTDGQLNDLLTHLKKR